MELLLKSRILFIVDDSAVYKSSLLKLLFEAQIIPTFALNLI